MSDSKHWDKIYRGMNHLSNDTYTPSFATASAGLDSIVQEMFNTAAKSAGIEVYERMMDPVAMINGELFETITRKSARGIDSLEAELLHEFVTNPRVQQYRKVSYYVTTAILPTASDVAVDPFTFELVSASKEDVIERLREPIKFVVRFGVPAAQMPDSFI